MAEAPEDDARATTIDADEALPDSEPPEPEPIDLDDPALYSNRELSLLEFQRRVLDLGLRPDFPRWSGSSSWRSSRQTSMNSSWFVLPG
ncbi:MAG: hypothetical protein R2849_00425 [Thermomicrobiales bacterium]